MKLLKKIIFCYVISATAFILGIYVMHAKVWPYSIYERLALFIVGGSDENTTVVQKIKNDMNIKPYRFLRYYKPKNQKFTYKDIEGLEFQRRRLKPKFFLSDNAPKGYRLIVGTFDFIDGLHGAILLDQDAKVLRHWIFTHEGVDWKHPSETNIFPHGYDIARDGTMAVSFGGGGMTLIKYGYCGNVIWQIKGGFHHSIDLGGENHLWAWGEFNSDIRDAQIINKIDFNTGDIIESFSIYDVIDKNPDIDILEIRKKVATFVNKPIKDEWLEDPFHGNDIDVLNEVGDELKNIFVRGDLLLSLRSINLILVLDPKTLRIKWWRQGIARRQHDPDWDGSNLITLFNNNTGRGFSKITAIDPNTYEHTTILNGEDFHFYSESRGKHQILPNGGILITSADQGRVFEIDAKGNITFEFINKYDDDGQTLILTDARFIPNNFFEGLPQCE